jgi:D-3-phosphoglycerate dehydrogenase
MRKFNIKTINAIAQEGLALLDERYHVDPDEKAPDGIIIRSSPLSLDEFPELLAISRAGAGVNNIPVDEATERGICVLNTPGANANAVVELVFTMLGIWIRNVNRGLDFCSTLSSLSGTELDKAVEERKKRFKGQEMAGKTLGVIGLGKIGVQVANSGVHHRMRVIGFDPFPLMDNIHDLSPDVKLARSRKEVLEQADYVSIHVPLNKNTEKLVSDDFLGAMKKGGLLINYARGPVVDNEAVLRALESGKLSGHITDFPSKSILGNDRILITPHLGASTEESEDKCACMAVKGLKSYLEYGNITHSVNFPNVESIPTVKVRNRLVVINRDRPGMIGLVTNILGRHNINIMSFVNESNGTVGYNIIDCDAPVADHALGEINRNEDVLRTRVIRFH